MGEPTPALWAQIFADVLDREIRPVKEPRLANARGAGFIAGVALGYLDWADVPGCVEYSGTFRPNAANRAVYDRQFDVFEDFAKKTKGLFARLNRGIYHDEH